MGEKHNWVFLFVFETALNYSELLDSSWLPLVEILSFCETPERSCGLHCVTGASVQIGVGRDFFFFVWLRLSRVCERVRRR